MLKKADPKLKESMNKDIERFIRVTKKEASVKGVKWEDIVIRFEWTYEQDAIIKFMNGNEFML